MRIDVDMQRLGALMAREVAAAERATTAGVRAAGDGLKRDWRGQVVQAGLGRRLANTIRGEVYPRGGVSLAAAATVYARAPKILLPFESGEVIRSRNGFWLAIPLPAAGRGIGGRRLTPGQWEKRNGLRLRLVYRRPGPSFLVADRARIDKRGRAVASRAKTGRGQVTAPIFLLVPQVRIRKRLDLAGAATDWQARIPGAIADAWLDRVSGDG